MICSTSRSCNVYTCKQKSQCKECYSSSLHMNSPTLLGAASPDIMSLIQSDAVATINP